MRGTAYTPGRCTSRTGSCVWGIPWGKRGEVQPGRAWKAVQHMQLLEGGMWYVKGDARLRHHLCEGCQPIPEGDALKMVPGVVMACCRSCGWRASWLCSCNQQSMPWVVADQCAGVCAQAAQQGMPCTCIGVCKQLLHCCCGMHIHVRYAGCAKHKPTCVHQSLPS